MGDAVKLATLRVSISVIIIINQTTWEFPLPTCLSKVRYLPDLPVALGSRYTPCP